MFSLFGVPVDAAYHVVTAISAVLTPLAGGLAVVAAIIVFTVAVRLMVLPFSYYAMRGQITQARIAPQVQALRQRYAKQPERLTRELTALYRENGTSMFAGCLPLLLQWPFLSVMYLLFRSASIGGVPNALLSHYLFGARLGSHWLSGAGPLSAQGAVFAALFLLLAAIGWLAVRASRRLTPPAETVPGATALAGLEASGGRGAWCRWCPACRCSLLGDEPAALPHGGLRGVPAAGRRAVPADHDRLDAARAQPFPAGPQSGARSSCTVARSP